MIDTAKKAALAAGRIILKGFNQHILFEQKKDNTFVSDIDRQAEKKIKAIISTQYPKHAILGEEYGSQKGNEYTWHIDPLDGTSNYKNRYPFVAVSLGLEKNGEFILGVIYNPFTKELFSAEKNKGAYLNGKRIKVNTTMEEKGIYVIDGSFRDDRALRKLETQKRFLDYTSSFRIIGSNVLQLTEIARGRAHASLSDAVHSYDYAAGIVLITEAGGIITDQYGNIPTPTSKVILASNNKELHTKLVKITQETYKDYKGM